MKAPTQILIIEDDPALAQSLRDGLEREGYTTIWKNLGAEGVNYACNHHSHLILLDVRLPDGSGFDFCAQMRKSGLTQPIIILTVQREEADKVLGLEMGADDYITKPFSLRELISRIRAQLRRAYGELSSGEAKLLYVGDLVVDQSSGQVKRGKEIISLNPVGFRLLVYLARHKGQALTRSQIIESVWGHTTEGESERIVDVQISRLREKIESDPGNPKLILTVPGIGYRLVEPG
ncbi:MAG: response regulator transcription factor [Anaerolineales bacterium]|jgi:DNA-binding response OmpR family regulator